MLNWNGGLIEFNSSLPELKSGVQMFDTCALTNFNIPLPKLENGSNMFYRCGSLSNFESDLPSLQNGNFMFENSKLNKTSVIRIINSLPTYNSGSHVISLGIQMDYKYDKELNYHLKRLNSAYEETVPLDNVPEEYKGWGVSVYWRGSNLGDSTKPPMPELEFSEVILPENYTRLSCLISNGNTYNSQFINTGVLFTDKTGVYVDFEMLSEQIDPMVLGTNNGTGTWVSPYFKITGLSVGGRRGATNHTFASFSHSTRYPEWVWSRFFIRMNYKNDRFVWCEREDGTKRFYADNLTEITESNPYPIYLFTENRGGNKGGGNMCKIFRCIFTEDGNTIRDFVPCLDENGVACMYDLITKTPYYDGSNQEFSYETIS